MHLKGPHEWDPSVLDYTHPSGDGEPPGPMTLMRDLPLILTLMSLGTTPKGQYKLSVFWMTLHPLYPMSYPHDQPTCFQDLPT